MIKREYKLHVGDCIKVMQELIGNNVKVDSILTDSPYGTTSCRWDDVCPSDEMDGKEMMNNKER